MTLDGQVLGTPAYMPPEQARGEGHAVDARGDVYSLGVILHELLTGELSFRGSSRMLIVQVIQDEPRPPRRVNDKIPRDLETICLKAMSKTPARRYATARDLADDLRRWVRSEPIHARPVRPVERLWRWCGRNPLVASLAAVIAFLSVIGTAVAVTLAIKSAHARDVAIGARHEAETQSRLAEERLEHAQHSLYDSHLSLVASKWSHDPSHALSLLEDQTRCPPPLRDFAWRFYRRLCTRDHVSWSAHIGRISFVGFTRDGSTLVTTSHDGTSKIWNARRGELLWTLSGNNRQPVTAAAISPDGKGLLVGDASGQLKLWDLDTSQERILSASPPFAPAGPLEGRSRSLPAGGRVAHRPEALITPLNYRTLGIGTPDRHRLASSSDGTIKISDARPWTPELRAEQQAISLPRFLCAKRPAKDQFLQSIHSNATISEPARRRA